MFGFDCFVPCMVSKLVDLDWLGSIIYPVDMDNDSFFCNTILLFI